MHFTDELHLTLVTKDCLYKDCFHELPDYKAPKNVLAAGTCCGRMDWFMQRIQLQRAAYALCAAPTLFLVKHMDLSTYKHASILKVTKLFA